MRDFQRPNLSKILKAIAFLFEEATTRCVSGLEIMQAIGEVDSEATGLNDSELKKFQRLKKDIRDLGIPLESPLSEGRMQEEGPSEYRVPWKEYALRNLNLSRTDETSLALIGDFISQDDGFPLRANLAMALEKLSQVSSRSFSTAGRQGLIFPSPETIQPKQDPNILNDLILANSRIQPVSFHYQGVHANRTIKRNVEPYGLFSRRQVWYLVGRDIEKDEVRVFRVSRIEDHKKIEVLARETFRIPEGFRLRDYASVPPWNFFSDAEEKEVEVQFSKEEFWRVENFCKAHGSVEAMEKPSAVLWRLKVREFDPLVKWLLPYGIAAKPLGPPEFKRRYQEIVREALNRYARSTN